MLGADLSAPDSVVGKAAAVGICPGTTGQLHSSCACKVILKIFQARLPESMNQELPRVSSWLSKRQRNQRSNCKPLLDPREREIRRNLYLCFIELAKAFDCVDHNKLWKTLKEMGIPNHLTCLLRNLYAGHEATVRTFCGTTDWFKIEKAV